MARKPRTESSEGLYHVLNRGNYRTSIFESEGAKKSFQQTLFEACEKFSWNLSAYCVMSNHYHLCVGTPQGNLSEGMRWLQASFALRFNRFRKENGHLFQGRFKSLIVEPGKHWRDLVDYIHLNPVRAETIELSTLGRYPWTSLYDFPKRKSRARFLDCSWMDYDAVLDDSRSGWTRYVNLLAMKGSENPDEIKSLNKRMCRGWCIGEEGFKKAVAKELSAEKQAQWLEREALVELNSIQWSGMLETCLRSLGKTQKDLLLDRKSSAWKKAIASKMRESTSVNSAWLGEKLLMGPGRNVNSMVSYYENGVRKKCEFAKILGRIDMRKR
jgi:putative transposase